MTVALLIGFLVGAVPADDQEPSRAEGPPAPVSSDELRLGPEGSYRVEKPSPEVRRAIRLLLSSSLQAQRRGRNQLLLLGRAVAPQLRYSIRDLHENSSRVESVLSLIEGDDGRSARLSSHLEEFWSDKFREAAELKDRGEYRQARKLAEAMLTLDPSQPGDWELRRFVRECTERIAARELLEPGFSVERLVSEVGDLPRLVFRIRNHSDQRARIHLESGVLGRARVTVTLSHESGAAKRTEERLIVRADAPDDLLIIDPGQSWEQEVSLNMGPLPLSGVVARVRLAGRFRPTRWTTEDKNDNLSLSMPRTEFWIVPTGQSKLADRPLQKLTTALVFDRDAALFVGGQLAVWVGEGDPVYNGKLVDTLTQHLDRLSGPRLAIALRLLERATGMGFGTDPQKWKSWWESWTLADGGQDEAPADAPARHPE